MQWQCYIKALAILIILTEVKWNVNNIKEKFRGKQILKT